MIKNIKFPLKMKNGTSVRSIEELKENADIESIVSFFLDGKLNRWCKSFHYDNIPDKLAGVSELMIRKIYESLDIKINEDELRAYLNDNAGMLNKKGGYSSFEMDLSDNNELKSNLKKYCTDDIVLDNFIIEHKPVQNDDGSTTQYQVLIQDNQTKNFCSFMLAYNPNMNDHDRNLWTENLHIKIVNAIRTMKKNAEYNGTNQYYPNDDFILVQGNGEVLDFYICDHPVTQAEYELIMGKNPSEFKGDNNPVECVSWYDAIEYCNKRSIKEGLTSCYNNFKCDFEANGYRLPTKGEWGYAASGGNKTNKYTYSGGNVLAEVGWYAQNSDGQTHPVKEKKPNELGIYDMSGNVYEWCWSSRWDVGYNNGSGNNSSYGYSIGHISAFFMKEDFNLSRCIAGGSWDSIADSCSAYARGSDDITCVKNTTGFRVVKTVKK